MTTTIGTGTDEEYPYGSALSTSPDVIAQRGVLPEGVRFIQKPYSRSDLARKIHEVLEGSPPE